MTRLPLILFLAFITLTVSGQCKKCAMSAVKAVDNEAGIKTNCNYDDKVFDDFFCSIDKKCKDATFIEISGEMVVVLFSMQPEKCLKAINKNPSIDKQAILDIFSSFKIGDLPYDEVQQKISKKTKRTDFENKILQALANRKKKGL